MHLKKRVCSLVICLIFLFTTAAVFAGDSTFFSKENLSKASVNLEKNITSKNNVLSYEDKDYSCKSIFGAVIASAEGMNACWARDTALVMRTIARFYKDAVRTNDKKSIQKYGNYLINYVSFLKKTVPTLPPDHAKFYIDGKKFPWMNQADGPALRVITLVYMAQTFIDGPQTIKIEGTDKTVTLDKSFVENNFFSIKKGTPETNLIKYEVDFISKNWQKKTIDLWEESSAHHFFSELVQMKACLSAAVLAKQLGLEKVTDKYIKISYKICISLRSFYNHWEYYGIRHNLSKPLGSFNCYTENRKPSQTPFKDKIPKKWYNSWHRGSGLNSSTMLGVIYANMFADFQENSITHKELSENAYYKKLLDLYNDRNIGILPISYKVIQTIFHYQNAFTAKSLTPYAEGLDIYPFNNKILKNKNLAAIVGRYPGDNYNGVDWSKVKVDGNPWYITTCGLANYYYTLAHEYKIIGKIIIPDTKSDTPDVVKFFRQMTKNGNIQPGSYTKDSKTFNEIISGLMSNANKIMRTVVHLAKPYDMHMSEQINRNTGKEASYKNLTWSYSSYLDAHAAFLLCKLLPGWQIGTYATATLNIDG